MFQVRSGPGPVGVLQLRQQRLARAAAWAAQHGAELQHGAGGSGGLGPGGAAVSELGELLSPKFAVGRDMYNIV